MPLAKQLDSFKIRSNWVDLRPCRGSEGLNLRPWLARPRSTNPAEKGITRQKVSVCNQEYLNEFSLNTSPGYSQPKPRSGVSALDETPLLYDLLYEDPIWDGGLAGFGNNFMYLYSTVCQVGSENVSLSAKWDRKTSHFFQVGSKNVPFYLKVRRQGSL